MAFDFLPVEQRMQKALDHVVRDIASLRTGKATSQILDPVMVEAYGTKMKIVEVASIQVQDPTLLVVTPWDKSLLVSVEKAIASSNLNLNPVVDGDIIRIQIAPLTEEKRKEMVKVLHSKIENGKVMLRTIRGDARKEIMALEGVGGVSEDDIESDNLELEELLKTYIEKMDEVLGKKEKDLLTI
jgi:ribosome recycling factor